MVVRAFVPKKSIGRLSSAISKYGEWSEGQHKPAFTDFFEGIDNLTVADVERLWHARDGVELPKDGIQRWEVWLRPRVVEYVKASSSRYSVELSPFETRFPNATVIRMRAAFAGLKALLLDTASVIEIRPASTANVPISALTPVERAGLVRKIASRIAPAPEGSPRVAILDTGVQFQHGLLRQSLPEARTHTVLPAWQKDDVRRSWHPNGGRRAFRRPQSFCFGQFGDSADPRVGIGDAHRQRWRDNGAGSAFVCGARQDRAG